jgi:hypothetical protein
MNRATWSRILIIAGGIAIVVGAIDPMEGSLLILPGSGLLAVGSHLGRERRRSITGSDWAFILTAIGVAAMWGLTAIGGFGGTSGRSAWWGVLMLPYVIGWSIAMWGPNAPRWVPWLGIPVGMWYLTIFAMVLRTGHRAMSITPAIVIGAIGLVTIGGCLYRLRRISGSTASA